MKTLLIAAAITALSLPAFAQAVSGPNCEWAYKKLQQHRDGAVCREQTVSRGLDGATDHGKTARRAEAAATRK